MRNQVSRYNKLKQLCYLLVTGLFLLYSTNAFSQVKPEPIKKTRILFLLDCSGSMLAKWSDGDRQELRMVAAKRIMTELVDSLVLNKHVELALRCYGHQFDKAFNNCEDTRLEIGFAPNNHEALKQKIKTLTPRGTTPIAYSLEQAANDFPPFEKNTRNIIIIITDGLESCKGDPCAISIALQRKRIFLKPFVIGIGKLEDFGKDLDCLGKFVAAENADKFKSILSTAIKESLQETFVTVRLYDAYNQPKETNVNISFVNNVTGEYVYDFVHRLDASGKFENYEIDPLITYDVIVNTVPQVIKRNISLQGGTENYIDIKCPQGYLTADFITNSTEYKNLRVLVKKEGSQEIINNQKIKNTERYLTGKYDVEILTLPRFRKTVTLKQDENEIITLPVPGVLNISQSTAGFGSLYLIKVDGTVEWIYNFENNNSKTNIPIQPGNYKMVFRSKQAISSKFTDVQYFTIKSGLTTTINLFNK